MSDRYLVGRRVRASGLLVLAAASCAMQVGFAPPREAGLANESPVEEARKTSTRDGVSAEAAKPAGPAAFTTAVPDAQGRKTVAPKSASVSAQDIPARVRVTAPDAEDGEFAFVFTAMREGPRRLRLRLDEIITRDDGGTRAENWTFDVFVDEQFGFRIPERSYDDDRPVTRFDNATAGSSFETAVLDLREIRVVGYRSDHAPPAPKE